MNIKISQATLDEVAAVSAANNAAPTRKSFTTFVRNLKANYENRKVQLSITNGRAGISLSLRNADEFSGVLVNMTPKQAREVAAELVDRATEIEENPL